MAITAPIKAIATKIQPIINKDKMLLPMCFFLNLLIKSIAIPTTKTMAAPNKHNEYSEVIICSPYMSLIGINPLMNINNKTMIVVVIAMLIIKKVHPLLIAALFLGLE